MPTYYTVILSYLQRPSILLPTLHALIFLCCHSSLWQLLTFPLMIMIAYLFRIEVNTCSWLCQAYIMSFTHAPIVHSLWTMHCSFIGSYIISILDLPVFHVTDLDLICQQLCSQDDFPPCSVSVIIALEQCSSFDDHPSIMPLCLHDIYMSHCCSTVKNGGGIINSWIYYCNL